METLIVSIKYQDLKKLDNKIIELESEVKEGLIRINDFENKYKTYFKNQQIGELKK
jgi:predicted  nucleic acid-binding Zn-ribbon protein